MGGFLGIGGNSENTDRGAELGGRQGLWNVFNYALPQGQQQQAKGEGSVDDAGAFFSRMLKAGRTETAATAAPAINATVDAADARRNQEAAMGTGRTGGTAEVNRAAAGDTDAKTSDIISKQMVANKAIGGQGALEAGNDQLSSALRLLGLGDQSAQQIMSQAAESRKTSHEIHGEAVQNYANAIGKLAALFL